MAFKRGPQYRVFITLENPTASVNGTGITVSVVTATASLSSFGPNGTANSGNLGISALGAVTTTASVIHEIKNITGIEPAPASVDSPFEVFGQTRPLDNPIRKKWGLTLTRKAEDKLFLKVFAGARFGVTGTSAPGIFDGLSAYPDQTGYRLYVWDGTDFDLYYQGTIVADGYKVTLSPTGVTEEAITFEGGTWKPGTTGSDLTSSQSIVQA